MPTTQLYLERAYGDRVDPVLARSRRTRVDRRRIRVQRRVRALELGTVVTVAVNAVVLALVLR